MLLAATPALERASVKLDRAFESMPSGNPEEQELMGELRQDRYDFEGEERLTLEFDIDRDGTIQERERIDTAWGFKEDLNGDGDPDRYNIYGIFFRNPPYNVPIWSPGPRTPVEARGNPVPRMDSPSMTNPACPQFVGSTSQQSGSSPWLQQDSFLTKPFLSTLPVYPSVVGVLRLWRCSKIDELCLL